MNNMPDSIYPQCGSEVGDQADLADLDDVCASCDATVPSRNESGENSTVGTADGLKHQTDRLPDRSLPKIRTVLELLIAGVIILTALYLVVVYIKLIISIVILIAVGTSAFLFRDTIKEYVDTYFTTNVLATMIRWFAFLLVTVATIWYLSIGYSIFVEEQNQARVFRDSAARIREVTEWYGGISSRQFGIRIKGEGTLEEIIRLGDGRTRRLVDLTAITSVIVSTQMLIWLALYYRSSQAIEESQKRSLLVLLVLIVGGFYFPWFVHIIMYPFLSYLITVKLAKNLNAYTKSSGIRGAGIDVDLAWGIYVISLIFVGLNACLSWILASQGRSFGPSSDVAAFTWAIAGAVVGLILLSLLLQLQKMLVPLGGQLRDAVDIIEDSKSKPQHTTGSAGAGWHPVLEDIDDALD